MQKGKNGAKYGEIAEIEKSFFCDFERPKKRILPNRNFSYWEEEGEEGKGKSVFSKVVSRPLMSSKDDMFADSIFSHRKRMETISEIVEGEIYLSSLLAATQAGDTLKGRGITHVISLLKEPFNRSSTVEYMVIGEDDSADTDLKKYFASINAFIGTFLSVEPTVSLCVEARL